MRFEIYGTAYDTAEMLDLHIGPVEAWMGGAVRLVGAYADEQGRVYLVQDSPHVAEASGRVVGIVVIRASRAIVRHLVERFELPAAYLAAAEE